MQNLINSLNRGISEVNEVGENILRPPTATMLRAARTIADLANQAQSNQQIMMQLQARIDQQLQELETLTKELEDGKRIYSLRESGRHAGDVESSGKDDSISDQSSAERTPAEDSSPGSDQMSNQKGAENAENSSSPNADASAHDVHTNGQGV